MAAILALVASSSAAEPAGTAATAAEILPDAEWVVAGQLQSPTGPGAATALSGSRALLTGSDGSDAAPVYLYEPGSGLVRVTDAPAPLTYHFAARLPDGRVLVGGGGTPSPRESRDNLTARCFIYDPTANTWSETAPLPHPSFYLYGNTAATLLDGRVLVTGGSTPADAYFDRGFGEVYLASRNVFLFDPVSGSWSEGAPMPTTRVFATHAPAFSSPVGIKLGAEDTPPRGATAGRVAHQMVVLADGRVLLVGGREYNPGWFYGVSPIDAYDPATNTWTRLATLPGVPEDGDGGYGGRGFLGATVLASGKVLIFGGTASRFVERGNAAGRVTFTPEGADLLPRISALLFDPATGRFQRVGDLNVRRTALLATAWSEGGGAFAIGGRSTTQTQPVPEAEAFDPVSGTWSILPLEPVAGFDFSPRLGALLTDGTILTWSADFTDVKRLHPMGL